MRLRLGYSSCPNDTFMFHALVTDAVSVGGVEFDVVEYLKDPLDREDLVRILEAVDDPPSDMVRRDAAFRRAMKRAVLAQLAGPP